MERHFILPMTIAAALHAGLLFGIHPAHITPAIIETVLLGYEPPPPPVETVEPAVSKEIDSSSKKSDTVPTPVSVEPPPLERDAGPTIEMPPIERIVPTGPFGKIAFDRSVPGPGEGIGNLSGILSSRLLDQPPRANYQAQPVYPFEAKKEGLNGEVLVEFTVDETGRVLDPRVVNSSNRIFDEATLRAVAKWRFETGTRDGRAVRFRMMVPVKFNLSSE